MPTGMVQVGAYGREYWGTGWIGDGNAVFSGGAGKIEDAQVVNSRFFLAGNFGLGLDLSLGLPYYYESLSGFPGVNKTSRMGDASFLLKWALPWSLPLYRFAVYALATAPTSSSNGIVPKELEYVPSSATFPDATSQALGLRVPSLGGGLAVTVDFSEMEIAEGTEALLHLNLSQFQTLGAAKNNPLTTLHGSLAAEASPMQRLRVQAEIRHDVLVASPDQIQDPLGQTTVFTLGVGWSTPWNVTMQIGTHLAPQDWNSQLKLATGPPLGNANVTYRLYPTASIFLEMAWHGFPGSHDADGDGIPDGLDKCPHEPEDFDGFEDEDGCPDPDNDGDGIPDIRDKCPYAAEDFDGFEDQDGCPDLDNDGDGIPDAQDKCPNEPEDFDGFQDQDGCPDLDNDGDGIPDAQDKCPNEPENFNGIEDADGCPEVDSDGDGIPDTRDKCPHEKEIFNFYQDEDGCPDERPEPIRDGVLKGVDFKPGTSELLPTSRPVLDSFVLKMAAYPGTEIEIQGHVDNLTGTDPQALSQARAMTVAAYLVDKGVEIRRLKPLGYGTTRPAASSRTAQGRELNRRIEIKRLN